MKFDTPVAAPNPIDQLKVVGHGHNRVEGRLKTTGTATYAYEHHDVVKNVAYGYVVGTAIAKGRINKINLTDARKAPGVIAIVTYENARPVGRGSFYAQRFIAAPSVDHYHHIRTSARLSRGEGRRILRHPGSGACDDGRRH